MHLLLEEAASLYCAGKAFEALERAMEARRKERAMSRFMDQNGLGEQISADLTFAVDFNLAYTYQAAAKAKGGDAGLYEEALREYTALVKNKALPGSGRLRVNMGNIYFEQKKYPAAIKMYRMALDQIPATNGELKVKILRSIGLAFTRMGQFLDAVNSFEQVMEYAPDTQVRDGG